MLSLSLVSGALLASAPSCLTPPVAPLAAGPVHVPIEVSNNHVFVAVCVGDKPLSFILDSGAGQTFLDIGLARAAGLKTKKSRQGRGAGAGSVEAAEMESAAVRLAGTDVTQAVAIAIDLSGLVPGEGHAMDGILGHDFMERYVVTIDYAASELRLYDRRGHSYKATGSSVPLRFINNHPQVDAELRLADGGTVRGRFIVDVGAAGPLSLAKPAVDANHLRERVGPTIHKPAGRGVGGFVWGDVGRVAALRIGDVELKAPITALFGDSAGVFTANDDGWIGNISGEILRRFTVTFDYRAKRMTLEPNASIAEPFETDMSGLAIVPQADGRLVVSFVLPNSPASDAGVRDGDLLVSINGHAVTASSVLAWRKVMRHEGERMTMTVRRAGETKTIHFTTRRLV